MVVVLLFYYFFNLLLCLIYKLNFITERSVQEKKTIAYPGFGTIKHFRHLLGSWEVSVTDQGYTVSLSFHAGISTIIDN